MKLKSRKIKSLSLGLLLAAASIAQAAPNDNTSPYVDPQRDCLVEGLQSPQGKEFRYLYSRDCSVVHVLPPAVMPQQIKGKGVNLSACTGMSAARNSMNTLDLTIDEARTRQRAIETALDAATKREDVDRLQAKLKDLTERIQSYQAARDNAGLSFDKNYGQVPGAEFSVLMQDGVTAADLSQIRDLNRNILRKEIRQIDPSGKETRIIEESAVRAAQPSFSVYSFYYHLPKDAGDNGGLLRSEIPGLEYLRQEGSTQGVVHVYAQGGITGKVIMNLPVACDRSKKDTTGNYALNEDSAPFFDVNRTFEVQQMFAQGYKASLKTDKVVNQITKFVTTNTDKGFQKSEVFVPIINANIKEIMDFDWTSNFDDGKQTSFTTVQQIQAGVAAKLVDNYVQDLVAQGILKEQPDRHLDPANGGYTDDPRIGHRCWSESDGGISGFFGGSHTVCGDYTYTVKVWHDGITDEEIRRALTLNGDHSDTMTVNMMTPFRYTTAFAN